MQNENRTLAIVGGQWGSEGKGVVVNKLGREMHFDATVRVGGPNAGHSFFHGGRLWKMQSVPCLWTSPDTSLFIGPGAVVNVDTLKREVDETGLGAFAITVDPRAAVISHEMEAAEADIRASIGSTAEGVGEARMARMARRNPLVLAGAHEELRELAVVSPTADRINHAVDSGVVLLEGTQGSGLSLLHGEWPYVTSEDTNAATLAAHSGLAPSAVGHVQLVIRTYPIRVAGNSGPMGREIDWQVLVDLGVVDQPEQTTVTKKTRRIAEYSDEVVDRAVMLNRPCGIWLMFADYLDPAIRGETDLGAVLRSKAVSAFVKRISARYGIPVMGVGTGPVLQGGVQVDWAIARPERGTCAHGVAW